MFRLLTILMCLSAWSLRAETATNLPPAVAGIKEFNAAFKAWNSERFGQASELFEQAIEQSPANVTNFYWLGVSEFHHMLQLRSTPGHAAEAEVAQEKALAALNTAIKLDAHHAESHALLGSIYGIRIGERWIRAIRLGPRIMKHCEAALKDGEKNPRVRYLLATGEFYMASDAADARKALQSFLLAEKYFEMEATNAPGPLELRWGRSSCHTFTGLTYEKLGDFPRAAEYFRKAIGEHPADDLARLSLARVTSTNSVAAKP